jgi:hypothetical protein
VVAGVFHECHAWTFEDLQMCVELKKIPTHMLLVWVRKMALKGAAVVCAPVEKSVINMI